MHSLVQDLSEFSLSSPLWPAWWSLARGPPHLRLDRKCAQTPLLIVDFGVRIPVCFPVLKRGVSACVQVWVCARRMCICCVRDRPLMCVFFARAAESQWRLSQFLVAGRFLLRAHFCFGWVNSLGFWRRAINSIFQHPTLLGLSAHPPVLSAHLG